MTHKTMKDFTEKDLKGGMKATGLSAASLLCVCLAKYRRLKNN